MPLSKNNRKGKKRRRKNKPTTSRKGWDGKGGYTKTDGEGKTIYFDKNGKVKYVSPENPIDRIANIIGDNTTNYVSVDDVTPWKFTCPLDEKIELTITDLPKDTPGHCTTGAKNSHCPFISRGCKGCYMEHKELDLIKYINGKGPLPVMFTNSKTQI